VSTDTVDRGVAGQSRRRAMLNKVPEVTLWFWIIKVLSTTVGETFADYLNAKLGIGLTGTMLVMTGALAVALFVQFRAPTYVPWKYWLSVVLISIVGTLVTDNLVDNLGVSLVTCTIGFGLAMLATFAVWYYRERTLSIKHIDTVAREGWYWLAVLFTFALGTAIGDLIAERLELGYLNSLLLFSAAIALVAVAWKYLHLNAVAAFWVAYILTRPLGASLGDWLSQDRADGGLGFGSTTTSYVFLAAIVAIVAVMTHQQSVQRRSVAETAR
jgi:uncharacterized membrane-anchored protein